ncbi:hypothetical protein C4571_00240 [Candidatus Parcubacteria bacterium]|nr:MAG: hypothetical protein C4571_00240 [Candidatus Parcubacteria bacterium]
MERSKIFAIVVAVVVIVVVVGFSVFIKRAPAPAPENGAESPASATRAPAPEDIRVPEKDSTDVPENVAVPEIVAPSAPTSQSSFRSFDIKVERGKFVPDTVVVRKGDSIQLSITAVDGDYDFVQPDYGVRTALPEGVAKRIGFTAATDGKFTFFCESCGGPDRGPVGYIVVSQK